MEDLGVKFYYQFLMVHWDIISNAKVKHEKVSFEKVNDLVETQQINVSGSPTGN